MMEEIMSQKLEKITMTKRDTSYIYTTIFKIVYRTFDR